MKTQDFIQIKENLDLSETNRINILKTKKFKKKNQFQT
jgi:hypothetical protein